MATSAIFAGLKRPFENGVVSVLLLVAIVLAIMAMQTISSFRSSGSTAVQTVMLSDVRHITLSALSDTSSVFGVGQGGGALNPPFADNGDDQLPPNQLEQQLAEAAEGNSDEAEGLLLSDGQRILSVDFDLSANSAQSGNLEVAKPVFLGGNLVGTVNVAIDQYSALHVAAEDLAGILPAPMLENLPAEEGYVAFDRLRNAGVGINYDPVGDALVIEL